ncbi:MAG: 3-isopropylmalate dehydrogenase, partial [Betaproteobacteria bacterium]|nr:3-isopropylmalate dehydrogenase [Betaproteobacteria bacterium]
VFGSAYWQRVLHLQVLVDEGVISPDDLQLFRYVDDVDQAWQCIQDFYRL